MLKEKCNWNIRSKEEFTSISEQNLHLTDFFLSTLWGKDRKNPIQAQFEQAHVQHKWKVNDTYITIT